MSRRKGRAKKPNLLRDLDPLLNCADTARLLFAGQRTARFVPFFGIPRASRALKFQTLSLAFRIDDPGWALPEHGVDDGCRPDERKNDKTPTKGLADAEFLRI